MESEKRSEITPADAETQRITENEIGTRVIEAAIAVHRELGRGLLETVYEAVLARELADRGLKVVRQTPMPITYKGLEEQPLRPCASAGEENVPTIGCYVAGIPSP